MTLTLLNKIEYLERVEYLAINLVQKLREMEEPMNDLYAEASAFGLEYRGPRFTVELSELLETLKEPQ